MITIEQDHRHKGTAGDGSKIDPADLLNLPLPVGVGGTGNTSLPSGAYLKGNGTGAITTQASPIPVTDGGTGDASFTAYSMVAAGSTSTGQFQSVGPGTSGQGLYSNGNTGLPSFQSNAPYISINTSHSSTTTQNLDDTFTIGYTPTIIAIYYVIDGLTSNGGTQKYSAGIAYFTGTTGTVTFQFFSSNTQGTTLAAGGGAGSNGISFGTGGATAGQNDANDISITLTVNATSSTGFTVRNAFSAGAGNTGTAHSSYFAVAYR